MFLGDKLPLWLLKREMFAELREKNEWRRNVVCQFGIYVHSEWTDWNVRNIVCPSCSIALLSHQFVVWTLVLSIDHISEYYQLAIVCML